MAWSSIGHDHKTLRPLPDECYHGGSPQERTQGLGISKGTVRFQAADPLPATLVRKLVKARIAENAG
jgi:uncharacterized protein YdhG (YjbR/CyaY superfamily)